MGMRRITQVTVALLAAVAILVGQGAVALQQSQKAEAADVAHQGITFGATIKASSCEQPPDQKLKDHASFTDAELKVYGLPPRPKDARYLASWEKSVRAAKTRICDMKPVYEDGKPKQSASLNRVGKANAQTPHWISCCDNGEGRWGGYVAYPNWYVYQVALYFNAPCIPSSWTTNNTDSSHWSGISGVTSYVVQSGTDSDTDWLGRPNYFAFVENTNPNSNGPGTGENYTFSVNCGDNMYSYNEIDQSNGNTPYMLIEDLTSGIYSGHSYGQGNAQDTFECISEKNNDRNGLADFNYVVFSDCQGADRNGNWSNLTGNFQVEEFVPHDPAGNQLISVSGLGGTDFDTYWDSSS